MRRWAILGAVLLLAGCKGADGPAGQPQGAAQPAAADQTVAAAATTAAAPPAQSNAAPAPAPANAAAPMLAYTYAYGIEAPPAKIRPLMAAHQAACAAAGPAVCQVTGSEVSAQGADQVSAKLTIRATPAWLKGYEDRLSHDAEGAGGRLIHSEVSSEDLTRDIVDTDAAVKAKTTLRDRLQTLLESHPGKIEDLLAVEDALAKAQADLDTTTSELAVMREQVATSAVTIEYDSAGVLAPQGVWSPVGHAASSVLGVFATSLAAIIFVIAFALPWAVPIGLVIWYLLRRRRAQRAKAAATTPKTG